MWVYDGGADLSRIVSCHTLILPDIVSRHNCVHSDTFGCLGLRSFECANPGHGNTLLREIFRFIWTIVFARVSIKIPRVKIPMIINKLTKLIF